MSPTDRRLHVVTATARVNAHPRAVYNTIANYRTGHPRILPKQFSGLTVEQGGVGAGTVISFKVRLLGRTDTYRAVITEPEPGRVLVEKNILGNDACTTFVVDSGVHPNEAVVTIRTELTVRRMLHRLNDKNLACRATVERIVRRIFSSSRAVAPTPPSPHILSQNEPYR